MDARAHRVVASTAGLLFASVGFSLSVLAVLFALLAPTQFAERAKSSASVTETLERRRARQLHVPVKPSSDISPTSSLAPSTPREEEPVPKFAITNHDNTRSPSPPPPIHSPENMLPPTLKRKPTTITFVQDLHTSSSPTFSSRTANPIAPERVLIPSEYEESRPCFKLLNLKPPWGEKRPKLHYAISSPHLTSQPPLPLPARDESRKHSPLGKKRSKLLRTEAGDTPTARSVSYPGVESEKKRVEKKKSQTLRTQPYEAPYFWPPPVPPIPDIEAQKRRKPTRSRTLPPGHRSAFQTSNKTKIIAGSLGPPADYHVSATTS